jgi:hypothetical protein
LFSFKGLQTFIHLSPFPKFGEENGIIVWDIQNNQHICTLEGQPQPIQQLALSSNREGIASYTS